MSMAVEYLQARGLSGLKNHCQSPKQRTRTVRHYWFSPSSYESFVSEGACFMAAGGAFLSALPPVAVRLRAISSLISLSILPRFPVFWSRPRRRYRNMHLLSLLLYITSINLKLQLIWMIVPFCWMEDVSQATDGLQCISALVFLPPPDFRISQLPLS